MARSLPACNDPQQFHHLAASEVDKDVQTSAVGVGVEFNEDLMLSLARDGKGNYHFLKDGADTQQVFARELDELTHVVAKDGETADSACARRGPDPRTGRADAGRDSRPRR